MLQAKKLFVGVLGLAVAMGAPAVAGSAQPEVDAGGTEPAAATAAVERVADLIRLWSFVRLFHIDPRAMTPDWERALEHAAAPSLAARDAATFAPVVKSMMERIQPSRSGPAQGTAPDAGSPEGGPFRLVAGRTVASCPAIAKATMNGGQLRAGDAEIAAMRQHGLILDCRGFGSGQQERSAFASWFGFAAPTWIERPIEQGAIRMRFHDGFPPDTGRSSGGYARGTSDVGIPRLEVSPATRGRAPRIVLIADSATPDPWALAGGLQAAGIGRVVAQGSLDHPGIYAFSTKHLNAAVMVHDYVEPDGRLGFRADSCVAAGASDAAMTAAFALLDGKPAAPCAEGQAVTASPAAGPVASSSPGAMNGDSSPLSLGERMVGLAKLWGTVEYFFPYHSHMDAPWSPALEEFIPIFASATTRHAYEEAVQRLAQRTDDSHVSVIGVSEQRLNQMMTPAIYIRPIGNRFAIAGLHDPQLADRLRPGDEIVAVDGRPVAEIVSSLRPRIAASTPQSFAQRAAALLTTGAADTEARLTIRRGNMAPVEVAVKRSMSYAAGRRPQTKEPSYSRIAPDIGYIDLDRLTREEADRAIDELMNTRAIIFDLRGYPQGTAWPLAARLALDGREGAVAALFRRPVYRSASRPRQSWTSFSQEIPTGTRPRYRGRIVVLIDDRAVSHSEHTALFFEAAANPVFVGTPTTGANGDVTSVKLPGGLTVRFTGHDVRHADGRQLQRVGIKPDILVAPTFAGLMSGRDEVLEAGIKVARAKTLPASSKTRRAGSDQ